ncbi:Sulfhydryl oxidase 2 [Exaiptasia diaphana]|nr:Sulfhydryl oxidase 2 [Exaiptasia diaphana]
MPCALIQRISHIGRPAFPAAWIVEFYSSWCGHCQAFAPTWKKLAKVARDWQNVIHVAAIDCADERNMQTCRDYDIAEYPTIKFFNASMEEKSNKGRNFKVYTKEDKTFINLLHTMVDVAEQQTHLSNHVPDFKSIEEKSTQDFMKGIGLHEILLIVFEEPYSYVGKELALDMMRFPQIAVRRSTDKKDYSKIQL